MKKNLVFGLMALMITALIGCAGLGDRTKTTFRMDAEKIVKLDKKGAAQITGNGFIPGSEVILLFVTDDGVQSDIGYALEPAPRADNDGSWITTWSYGRFVKKKMVKEGKYLISAVDEDFNVLCEASIEFVK